MATIPNGINGPVIGKVGKVVGSSRNGVAYIKGPYKKRTKKISKAESANRIKFAESQRWLRPLLDFVREGFKGYSQRSEGFVAAKSYLLKNAMESTGMDAKVNPALMQVSYGDLPLCENMAVEKMTDGQLKFTWDASPPSGGHPRDQAMLLAYDPQHESAFFVTTGQFRSAGEDTLYIDAREGRTYHVYFAFMAADRSRQSHSVYLGEVQG